VSARVAAALGLVLVGCSTGSGGGDGGAPDLAVADLTPRPDLRVIRDLWMPSAEVHGAVKDEAGNPLAGVYVLACSATYCPYVKSAADGSFSFAHLLLEYRIIKVAEDTTQSPRWGESVAPVHLTTDGAMVDAGTLYIPSMPAGANLAGPPDALQTLTISDDGLVIALRSQDLQFPLGSQTSNIAARRVPSAHFPSTIDSAALGGEQLIAAWALLPFGTKSAQPIPVTLPLALPAGSAVHLRTVDDLDGRLSAPVSAHAGPDGGATVATDAGQGITELSWILVSQ
jgi:hypothetical protein